MAHRPTHLSELQPSFENVADAQNQSVVHDFDVIAKEISDGRLKLNPKDSGAIPKFATWLQGNLSGMGPATADDVSMEVPSRIYDPGTIRIPQGIQPAPPSPPPVIVPPPPVAQETLDSERRLQLMEEFRSRGLMPPGGFTTDELEQMLATRDIAVGGEEGIKERQSTATSPMRMFELMQRMGEEIYAPIAAETGMGFWGPAPPEFLEAVEAERARGPMLGEVDPLMPEVRALRETSPEFFQMPILPGIPFLQEPGEALWTLGGAEAGAELFNLLNLPPIGTAQFVKTAAGIGRKVAQEGTEASLGRLKAIPSRKIGKQPFPGAEDISAGGPRALETAVRALDRLMTRDIAYAGTTPLGPEDIPTGGLTPDEVNRLDFLKNDVIRNENSLNDILTDAEYVTRFAGRGVEPRPYSVRYRAHMREGESGYRPPTKAGFTEAERLENIRLAKEGIEDATTEVDAAKKILDEENLYLNQNRTRLSKEEIESLKDSIEEAKSFHTEVKDVLADARSELRTAKKPTAYTAKEKAQIAAADKFDAEYPESLRKNIKKAQEEIDALEGKAAQPTGAEDIPIGGRRATGAAVGDIVTVFDPNGNPIKVKINAVGEGGGINVELPDGSIKTLEVDEYTAQSINERDTYTIGEYRTGVEWADKPVSKLTDEELTAAFTRLDERVKATVGTIHEQNPGRVLPDRNALELELRSRNLEVPTAPTVVPDVAPTTAAKRTIEFGDAKKESVFASDVLPFEEQVRKILNSDEEFITVWHGTNMRGATEILRTRKITRGSGLGPGFNLDPVDAVPFTAGRRSVPRIGDQEAVLLQLELPKDVFRNVTADQHGFNLGSVGSIRDEIDIDPSKVKFVVNETGEFTSRQFSVPDLTDVAADVVPVTRGVGLSEGNRWVVEPRETVFHGTRGDRGNIDSFIDSDGNLVLRSSINFEGRTTGVSFTRDHATAADYATRFPVEGGAIAARRQRGGLIFEIDRDAIPNELFEEAAEELATRGGDSVVIPKGRFRVFPVDEGAQTALQTFERETQTAVRALSNRELGFEELSSSIRGEVAEQTGGEADAWFYPGRSLTQAQEDIAGKFGPEAVDNPLGVFSNAEIRRRMEGKSSDELTVLFRELAEGAEDLTPFNRNAPFFYGPDFETHFRKTFQREKYPPRVDPEVVARAEEKVSRLFAAYDQPIDRPTTGTQITLEGDQVVSPATRQRGEVVQAELDPALELDRQRRRAELAEHPRLKSYEAARVSARQPTFRLPQGLAKSSPRFGRFELAFDSDLDRALYIASSRKRSDARDQFEALLRGVFGEDADFVEIAIPLRKQISDRVKRSKGDRPVQIPKVIDQPDVPRGVVSEESVTRPSKDWDAASRILPGKIRVYADGSGFETDNFRALRRYKKEGVEPGYHITLKANRQGKFPGDWPSNTFSPSAINEPIQIIRVKKDVRKVLQTLEYEFVSEQADLAAKNIPDRPPVVDRRPVTPRATVIPEKPVVEAPIPGRVYGRSLGDSRTIETDIGNITAQPGDSIEVGVSDYLNDIDEALKIDDSVLRQKTVDFNRRRLNDHLFGAEETPGAPGTYEGGFVIDGPDIDDINNIIKGQETIGKGFPLGDDPMDQFLLQDLDLKDPRHFITKSGTPKMEFRNKKAQKRFLPVEKVDTDDIRDEIAEQWATGRWQAVDPQGRNIREGSGLGAQDQFWADLNKRIDQLNMLDDLADEADRLGGTPRIQEILERNIIKKGERPERVVSRQEPSGVYESRLDWSARRGTLAGVLEPEDIGSRRSPEAGDRLVERRPFPGTREPIDTGERLSPGAGSGIPEQRIQREAGGLGARDRWEGKPRTLADLRQESRGQRAFTPAQRADLADETHPINTKNIAWRIRDYDAPMELLKSQTKVPEYLMKLPSPIRRGLEVVDTARLSRNDPGKMAGIQHNLFVEIEKARVAISVLNFKNRAQKLFSFRKGIARRVEVAEGVSESTPGLRTLDDILDHPEHYVLTPEQNEVINIGIDTQTQSLRDAQRLGVDVIELGSAYWHRIIRKAPVEPAGEPRIIGILRRRKGYTYERALQGIDQLTEVSGKGFVYEQDPYIRMAARLEAAVESMAAVHLQRRLTQLPGAETFGQRISKDVSKAHREAQESLLRARANYRQKGGDRATKHEELRTAESIYLQAWADLKKAEKKAKTPGIGEVILYNRIIPADVKKQVEEFVGSLEGATEPNKITGILSETAQLLRTMLTTADLAAGFIQGQGLFYRNHPKWWTAQVHGVLGFVDDPTAYVARNFDVMQRGMEKGAIMRPTEFLFAERGLASVPPRIPLIGPALKGFNRAFEWFIVVAQTELFKAAESQLLKKGIKGKTLEEELVSVGTAIRKGVGGESPAILGLRQNQVTIERLAFFASRLLRANAGLIAQATLTPGAGGREARRILGSVIAGGTALTIGINLASTGRFPNFTDTDASDWGKFRVGKRLYSAFGPYHPYFRTIARSSNRAARGNITGALREIGRFFRSKASIPVRALETSAEMYTRGYSTTFEGEIIEPSLLGAARLASEYLPIAPVEAAEGIAEGDPLALTEFVGLQGQPESRTLFLQRKAQEITNTDRKLEDLLYPEFITVVQSLTAEETAALAELDRLAANRGNRYAENRIAQSNLDGIGGIDRDTETAVAGRLTRETDLLLDLFGRGQESGRWRFKSGKEQTVKSQFWAWYNAYRIMTNDIYSRKDQDRRRILGEDAITEEERPGNDQPNAQALYDLWDINDQITTDTGLRHSEKYWALYESLRNTWTPEQKAFIDEYRELKEHAPGVEEVLDLTQTINKMSSVGAKKALDSIFRQYISDWQDTIKQFEVVKISASGEKQQQQIPEPTVSIPVPTPTETPTPAERGRELGEKVRRRREAGYPTPTPISVPMQYGMRP